MASKMLYPVAGALEISMIPLVVTINIASDASVSSVEGEGLTAEKTATGTYTLTLADKWAAIRSVNATLEAATAVDLVPQVTSKSASSKSVVIKTLAYDVDGAVAATDAAAACALHVVIWVRNSSI